MSPSLPFVLASVLFAVEPSDLAKITRIDASTPEEVQTALALSAGPPVAEHATVYVLGPTGYRKTRTGTNGFSCLVTREHKDTLEPECYDAEGSATTLKVPFFVEESRAQGKDEAWIAREIEAGYKSGRFTAPRRPGIVYMLSDYNYVFDPDQGKVIHVGGHLMFYAPNLTAKDLGSGPGAPYIAHPGKPDALMIVVPARH